MGKGGIMGWRRATSVLVVVGMMILAMASIATAQDAGYPEPTEGETFFPSDPPTIPPSDPPCPEGDVSSSATGDDCPPSVPPTVPPFTDPPAPPDDPPTLANTGIPLTTAAAVAGLLVIGGAGLVGMARRRRRS